MKNRFTKITSILAASMLLTSTASAQVSTASSTDKMIYNYRNEMYAISIDLREEVDYDSITAEKLNMHFNISCDSDGYTYIDFIVDEPTEIEDLELPITFYDHIENAMSDPVYIETIDGYAFQHGVPSGKILDDEGYTFSTYQLVRYDDRKHTVSGTVVSLKFAFEPMYVWCDAPQIPVMSYWWITEKEVNGVQKYIADWEQWACVDLPTVNISYLKEHEKQINELNSKIEELTAKVDLLKTPEFRYDFNEDGKVTIADAVLLMRYLNKV